MIVLDRKSGEVLRRDEITDRQREQLAEAFARAVLPPLIREIERRRGDDPARQA